MMPLCTELLVRPRLHSKSAAKTLAKRASLVFVLALAFGPSLSAQTDPTSEKGLKAFGSYAGGNFDSISLSNGKLNNLDNRLLQLADRIKGPTPATGTKIFVVQYEESDPTLKELLKKVATEPNAPYYFYAPDAAQLQDAFKQIAASLSVGSPR